MEFIIFIILVFILLLAWLVYVAITMKDPALTMQKEGNQEQYGDESDAPSEEMLNDEGWEKIDVLYDECTPGLTSCIYRSESLDKYRVITEDAYSNDLISDIFVSSYEEAKAEFQQSLDEYNEYDG